MCKNCNDKMNTLPEPLKEALEKYRGEMTNLAMRIGDDVAKHVVYIEPALDAETEELKQIQSRIQTDMAFTSLIVAACYAATAADHEGDTVNAMALLAHQFLLIGHYKSGQELFTKTLN